MTPNDIDRPETAEPAPLLGRWGRWYVVVIAELALIMVCAYLLTEAYR